MKKRLANLTIHPYNLEVYGEPDDGLKDSLEEFGLQHPIIVDGDNQILSGARRFAAAQALDWKTIEAVEPNLNGAPVEKYILIANAYRDKKSNNLKYCEARAWERLHASGKINLKEDEPDAGSRPSEIAARRAGLSWSTMKNMKAVIEPDYLDNRIAKAIDAGTIKPKQVPAIKKKAAATKKALQQDEIAPDAAYSAIKKHITDAEQELKSESERRLNAALEAIEDAVKAGDRFIVSLEKLTHREHARYLTEAHAARLFIKVQEIHHSLSALGKASRDLKGIEQHGLLASDH